MALKWTENLIHNKHVIAEERLNITNNTNIASFKQRKWLAGKHFSCLRNLLKPKIRHKLSFLLLIKSFVIEFSKKHKIIHLSPDIHDFVNDQGKGIQTAQEFIKIKTVYARDEWISCFVL